MDFITSIKQLSIHLTNLENNQFIDESLLEENKRVSGKKSLETIKFSNVLLCLFQNLSNSLIEKDLCLEDHSVSRFFLQLHQLTEASCRNGGKCKAFLIKSIKFLYYLLLYLPF